MLESGWLYAGSPAKKLAPIGEERIAMMRPLAEAAWRVAGLPMPRYSRSRIPVRLLVRRGGEEIEIPLPRRG